MSAPNPEATDASLPASGKPAQTRIWHRSGRLELLFTLIMAMAAIATAWAGFEASSWGSLQSQLNVQAAAQRAQANRLFTEAGQLRSLDAIVFTQWLNALNVEIHADPSVFPGQGYVPRENSVSTFLYARFRKEFRPAFDAWLAQRPLRNPDAPSTPLEMAEYRLASQAQAEALLVEAEAKAARALEVSGIQGDYVLLGVMFALVLFFVAVGNKSSGTPRRMLFGLSLVILVATLMVMLTFSVAP